MKIFKHQYYIHQWLILISLTFKQTCARGVAGIGGQSSGGDRSVCVECGGNYTEEEMNMALLIVGMILTMFLLILACQCYSRVMWECVGETDMYSNYKMMPPPPYTKRTLHPIMHQYAYAYPYS